MASSTIKWMCGQCTHKNEGSSEPGARRALPLLSDTPPKVQGGGGFRPHFRVTGKVGVRSSGYVIDLSAPDLGCAFRRNSGGFRQNLAKRHRPERNATGTGTGMCYNTILDTPVHSGWYLSTRFLQVENARNYSK